MKSKTPPGKTKRLITAHTIEAQVFRLVDSSGKERGLFQTSDDKAIFTLFSPLDNGPRIQLVTGLDGQYGYAELTVEDRSNVPPSGAHLDDLSGGDYKPIILGMHPFRNPACGYDPNARLEINGRESKSQAKLSVSLLDQPALELNDRYGEQRVQVCVWSGYGDSRIALHSPHSDEGVTMQPEGIHRFTPDGRAFQNVKFDPPVKLGSKEHKAEGKLERAKRMRYSPKFRAVARSGEAEIEQLQAKGLLPKREKKK